MRRNVRGFTLVELMVALALGLVTALATLEMLSTYLASERNLTARNDAQVNAAWAWPPCNVNCAWPARA